MARKKNLIGSLGVDSDSDGIAELCGDSSFRGLMEPYHPVTGLRDRNSMCWGAKAKWEKAAGIACFVAALMLAITVARGFGRGI